MRSSLAAILTEVSHEEAASLANDQFAVRRIPDYPGHLVGRTAGSFPSVLIASSDASLRAPIRLSGLQVSFAIPCQLKFEGTHESQRLLSVVTCIDPNGPVQEYFLHLMEALLRALGPGPSIEEIATSVQSLVEIMQQLANPAQKAVVGCFAELLTIVLSRDATKAIQAWRNAIDDTYDLNIEDARLEVKASGTTSRLHYFSAEQCQPPTGTIAALVSLRVRPAPAGTTIGDLVQRIEQRLEDRADLALKLRRVLAKTLGQSAPLAFQSSFDEHQAVDSLRLYDVRAVPAIRGPVPSEVTRIRFCSDLTNVIPTPRAALAEASAALDALLPVMIQP